MPRRASVRAARARPAHDASASTARTTAPRRRWPASLAPRLRRARSDWSTSGCRLRRVRLELLLALGKRLLVRLLQLVVVPRDSGGGAQLLHIFLRFGAAL